MRCLPYAAKRTWFRGYYVDNRKRLHPAQTIVVPIVFRFEGSRRENHGVIGPWKSNSVHRLLIVRLIAVLRFCINIQFFNNIAMRSPPLFAVYMYYQLCPHDVNFRVYVERILNYNSLGNACTCSLNRVEKFFQFVRHIR